MTTLLARSLGTDKMFNISVDPLKEGNEDYGILLLKTTTNVNYLDRANTRALIKALQEQLLAAGPEPVTAPEGTVSLVDREGDTWFLQENNKYSLREAGYEEGDTTFEQVVRLYGPVKCFGGSLGTVGWNR